MKFGTRVQINNTAPYFNGAEAIVAYVGAEGVSVYLTDSGFDGCIPLKNGEFGVLKDNPSEPTSTNQEP